MDNKAEQAQEQAQDQAQGKKRVETAARGLTILRLMQWGRQYTARDLAEALGVSERTVREYIAQLRRDGYNIHSAPGVEGAYQIQSGDYIPALFFDEKQFDLILKGLRALPFLLGNDHPDIAEPRLLYDKIIRQLPYGTDHRVSEEIRDFEWNMLKMSAKATAYDRRS
ncbi:helix-turn-helix transcriptional regulator [Corynebacterium riegelii]|uniref:helix-turn-helix transcriptional regulator n=1 Tax=Corynebacterium riegelii TaxID=156976 RepID=UPI00191CE8A1|nr:HTH domain-containing protein [Corynebacterium riegelii]QQU84303.1 HTH domain-containing protein [Corynebacterium riegelii]